MPIDVLRSAAITSASGGLAVVASACHYLALPSPLVVFAAVLFVPRMRYRV